MFARRLKVLCPVSVSETTVRIATFQQRPGEQFYVDVFTGTGRNFLYGGNKSSVFAADLLSIVSSLYHIMKHYCITQIRPPRLLY